MQQSISHSPSAEVSEVLEEIRDYLKILLSESNLQNQDMSMIKDDVSTLQLVHALLQKTNSDQSYQLNEIKSKLYKQGKKIIDIDSCLETFKENTAQDLEDLQMAVEEATPHPCGMIDDWIQVVNFDMTDSSTTCPSMWTLNTNIKRTCGRPPANTDRNMCFNANFPFLTGTTMSFSKVCGRVKAYVYGGPDAFQGFTDEGQTQISDSYVSGVSLTVGAGFSEHLWTFAAGLAELGRRSGTDPLSTDLVDQCPCDRSDPSSVPIPTFVGNQYFCEAAVNIYQNGIFEYIPDDPLWDGLNCNPESTCCDFSHPPYFVNDLGRTLTANSIDARLCFLEGPPPSIGALGDDILVEQIEVYIAP